MVFRTLLPAVLLSLICLSGCGGTIGTPVTGGTTPPPVPSNPNATGNWQINFTPTAGSALFPFLSGYIQDNVTDATDVKFTTAELTLQPTTGCFAGLNSIFSTGSIDGAKLSLSSASNNGQFLDIAATLDSTSTHLTGTYKVNEGCANGAQGTVTGDAYASLTGTYVGSVDGSSPAKTFQLTLNQNAQGNGDGTFLVTGPAVLTGFACFTTGGFPAPASFVTGSLAQLSLTTSDPSGAKVNLTGTFDTAADTLQLSSIVVTSGSCAGSYGTATLKRQS